MKGGFYKKDSFLFYPAEISARALPSPSAVTVSRTVPGSKPLLITAQAFPR